MDMTCLVHYTLGIPHLDVEHKKIFELINSVNDSCSRGDKDQELDFFMELLAFLPSHMEGEEQFMKEIGYPFIPHHREHHQHINEELSALLKNFYVRNHKYMLDQLSVLMLRHIDEHDMQYIAYYERWLQTYSGDVQLYFRDTS